MGKRINEGISNVNEEVYIKALKALGASEDNPKGPTEIYKEIDREKKYALSARTVGRNMMSLLGNAEEIEGMVDGGIGRKDRGDYYLGFKKKGERITGYWYEKKTDMGQPDALSRFLTDSVIYSNIINPEFKPDYIKELQDIFGMGAVGEINEFSQNIIDIKPYSDDDEIDVMNNVLMIQKSIKDNKKIKFRLSVYRYIDGEIKLDTPDVYRIVSPFQIMISNGHYYLMAKKAGSKLNYIYYRIDLMSDISELQNERADSLDKKEWKNPRYFLTANPFFYSGEKEDVVIGFEEENITQIVDWFCIYDEEDDNKLYQVLGEYDFEMNIINGEKKTEPIRMLKLKFKQINCMAFSFWAMQYMDCIEIIEGDKLKKILNDRMAFALEHRINGETIQKWIK